MAKEMSLGLLIVAAISAAAYAVSLVLPSLGAVTIAIVLGMLTGNLTRLGKTGAAGVRFAEKKLLNAAIILMGFELEFSSAADLGGAALLVVAGVIVLSLFLGYLAARFTSLPAKLALLLGIGSGICGSAAIAVCAPIMKAERQDVGISVAAVNLLGALAIFVLPALAVRIGLGSDASALLLGGTVQAVGQTVAAGLRMGDSIAKLATVVKMGRVLLLGVVALVLTQIYKEEGSRRFPVPLFIVAFLAAVLVVNLAGLPAGVLAVIGEIKDVLFFPAMAAIGMGIRLKSVGRLGLPSVGIAAILFGMNILFVVLVVSVY